MRIAKILLTSLLLLTVSCGDSNRNDQGVSFTFLGWFQDAEGDIGRTSFPPTPLSDAAGGELTAFAGVQNNLAGEFIRVNRVFHEYIVPGAEISIPGTSVSLGLNVGPADAENSNSTLPVTSEQDSVVFGNVPVVPVEIREFLALNRSQLPSLPFTMIVRSQAEGTTSGGRSLTTNFIEIDVVFSADLGIGDELIAGQ